MSYQQPPYQTTVMQPVVVQPMQPVVVPVVSGGRFPDQNRGPAHIRSGAKLGGHFVSGNCICWMSVFGGTMVIMSLIMLLTTNWDMTLWRDFGFALPPSAIPGIMLGIIGAPFAIISCYLCKITKENYDKQRSQENTAPYSEPFINAESSPGHVYSGQGQPAVGQPAVGTGSTIYLPVQSGAPSPIMYPHQNISVSYNNSSLSLPYSGQMGAVYQPSQPRIDIGPGEVPYPGPSSTSIPEKVFAPEYNQQPASAPPPYSP
ncbi:unnamed protein product [Meganyctiphanes norvegica]|uniref:Uncharacterized protein n=1 Tax=Meganyctiphanes norvegica TaxID=48144 RepID=A0AAV2PQ58_MEGNR